MPKRTELFLLIAIVATLAIVSGGQRPQEFGRQSKISEATGHLNSLFRAARSYYEEDHVMPDGRTVSACAIGSVTDTSTLCADGFSCNAPEKHPPPKISAYDALGKEFHDYVRYRYDTKSAGARCGYAAGTQVYTFVAHGDLDCDGHLSTVELIVESDEQNHLRFVGGIRMTDPTE